MNLKRLTLKELKLLAGQKLGELAAKLKTKADLISALEKLVPEKKEAPKPKLVPVAAAEVKPAPPPQQPKYGAPKAPVASPPSVKPRVVPKTAAPKPATPPAKIAAPGPMTTRLGDASLPKVTAPLAQENGTRRAQPQAAVPAAPSLTVTQDFFVMPGTARLPSSHADDRVLAFPRDTGGLYVSWDFSAATWGQGEATLEVVEGDEVLSSQTIDAPWGGRFIEVSSSGAVFVEIRRGPMLLGRSPFLSLPPGRGEKVQRRRLSVRWSEPLPTRAQAVASNRPYRGLAGVRAERVEASSEVRWLEEEERAWDTWDVTSRTDATSPGTSSRMA